MIAESEDTMVTYFDHGFSIGMTYQQAKSASHQGQCDDDVKALIETPAIRKQLENIKQIDIADELRGYGAWNENELLNNQDNWERIIWIAAGNIVEENRR
jgi:hypothetical protein